MGSQRNAQAEFLAAVAAGRTFQSWQNNHARKKRAAELAATTTAMPVGKRRWPVILADPPSDFEVYALDKQRSHPANHYPVMPLDEIKALPVAKLAFKDCVLFLWTTVPLLREALARVFNNCDGMPRVRPRRLVSMPYNPERP